MDSLVDIISDIRVFLYGGISTLPVTLAGTLLLIGSFTANYAILFFLIGFLVLIPASTLILNKGLYVLLLGINLLLEMLGYQVDLTTYFTVTLNDVCNLVIPFGEASKSNTPPQEVQLISYWFAMISFFIGYLSKNAIQLYSRESPANEVVLGKEQVQKLANKVTTRKSQALISIISIAIFFLIVFGVRYSTGCESINSFIGSGLFIYLGILWYELLSKVGEDRLSDLFGIANRLLSPNAIKNDPIACVPMKK